MDLLTIFLFVVGIGLLIYGADIMVSGASSLALAVGISPLVIGLTVVAFGTSAPELAVSVQSAMNGVPDIALGNVVGSNIANILLILGLSACVAPLIVAPQILRFDVPLMIGISVLMYVLALNGTLGFFEGLVLFLGLVAYTVWLIVKSLRDPNDALSSDDIPAKSYPWYINVLMVIGGLILLAIGGRWIVEGATAFARMFGVSELVIGLTIVAVGTSLPEVAVSVMASLRGERDIVVGNVIGSNIFNILSVLGITAMVAPAGIPVSLDAIGFDIPVMIIAALIVVPVLYTGREIARWEGGLLLLLYMMYVGSLLLEGFNSTFLDTYIMMAGGFVALVTVALVGLMIRDLYTRHTHPSSPSSG